MNIAFAIEELKLYLASSDQWGHETLCDAIKLGIEAMECILRLRQFEYFGYDTTLPGETKE